MAELHLNPPPKKDTRMLAVGLAVAAAVLLVFAAFSRTWVARPGAGSGEWARPAVGFGPLGCTNCGLPFGFGDDAAERDMSNGVFVDKLRTEMVSLGQEGQVGKLTSGAFAPMGYVTFGLCLLAALGLLGAAFLGFTKRRPELPISPASVALLGIMVGLITGCVFVATKPGGPGFVGVAIGFWAFAGGAILGIASAQMLAKLIRPVDPDLLVDSMNPDAY